jgi:hypothetical protein
MDTTKSSGVCLRRKTQRYVTNQHLLHLQVLSSVVVRPPLRLGKSQKLLRQGRLLPIHTSIRREKLENGWNITTNNY